MARTWFITGASRGLGVEFSKAALRAGDNVVATGRNVGDVRANIGPDSAQLLTLQQDVTDIPQTQRAVATAVERFGAIDALINNAGYGHLGFFEEAAPEDIQAQYATNVFGLFNVTRAVLPAMRSRRSGRIFNLSSLAGVRGTEFASLYCSSQFAIEGFSESLAREVAPFGIFVTIVEPGPFRTDFLSRQSLRFGATHIADYDARRDKARAAFEDRSGKQPGDPVKLAEAVIRLASEPNPPLRFLGGAFAFETASAKIAQMKSDFDNWREVTLSLDYAR
jgi:NAD(P)-dependent dehydrogenase (short-subunit alcohol dehydrogenase family)